MCMNNLHMKTSCCLAPVRRYGKRRKQCIRCKKTWRVRRKKRGRKARRIHSNLVIAYLARRVSTVRMLSQQRKEGKSSSQRALANSLLHYIRANSASWQNLVPAQGELIIVADAIWYYIHGKKYTIYVFLLRARTGNEATIWLPYLASGHEDITGWRAALATIPPNIQTRIGAIVSDGGTGIVNLACRNKWLLQRCHFHLLMAVQNYLTTGPRSRQRPFALEVMRLVKTVINDTDIGMAQSALRALDIVRRETKSRGLRRTLNGLMLHWREYRTYAEHPQWQLPTTSNAAESCIQCIRDLLYRCRGFRSQEQLIRWLAAFTIYKKTICCRPKNQPN